MAKHQTEVRRSRFELLAQPAFFGQCESRPFAQAFGCVGPVLRTEGEDVDNLMGRFVCCDKTHRKDRQRSLLQGIQSAYPQDWLDDDLPLHAGDRVSRSLLRWQNRALIPALSWARERSPRPWDRLPRVELSLVYPDSAARGTGVQQLFVETADGMLAPTKTVPASVRRAIAREAACVCQIITSAGLARARSMRHPID